jgi:hypothetical protein
MAVDHQKHITRRDNMTHTDIQRDIKHKFLFCLHYSGLRYSCQNMYTVSYTPATPKHTPFPHNLLHQSVFKRSIHPWGRKYTSYSMYQLGPLSNKTPENWSSHQNMKTDKKGKAIPVNRPWRSIGLWDVETPTFSKQSAYRWRWGC